MYVVDFKATPSRSEAGVGSAGTPLPKLRRQMPSLLAKIKALPFDMQVRLHRHQEITGTGGVGQACAFLQQSSHEFSSLRCRFHGALKPQHFVAPCTL
eukprot:2649223-Pleurochrysis_carterae.AAC.1